MCNGVCVESAKQGMYGVEEAATWGSRRSCVWDVSGMCKMIRG
jgi:hypothetical protein